MGSLGYNLGFININLTYDPDDPRHPPVSFYFLHEGEFDEITLTLEKEGKKESFHEHERYPIDSLLGDLLTSVEKNQTRSIL